MAQAILNRQVLGGVATDSSNINYKDTTVENKLDELDNNLTGFIKSKRFTGTSDSNGIYAGLGTLAGKAIVSIKNMNNSSVLNLLSYAQIPYIRTEAWAGGSLPNINVDFIVYYID